METLTNAANAASRAIWGESNTSTAQAEESGREPLSGETGNVQLGEPYDAGNLGNSTNTDTTNPSASGISSSTQKRWAPDDTSSTTQSTTGGSVMPATASGKPTGVTGNTAATGPIRSEHERDKTGVTSAHEPAQKHQGADRPTEEPSGREEQKAVKKTKDEAEEAQKVDISGPGPAPLSEKNKGASSSGGPATGNHGGLQKESQVKTSGMTADGGIFDASQAGAGSEADRLLETKGIHRDIPGQGSIETKENTGVPSGEKKKHGVGAKIKNILHKS
ncbi:MAG: hypothetical protein M1818_005982 [Claussenomyces sp. TS43310]|nr:MAG: hypothetical protein M1818_005982 [Claussenomyces sp. TS43310]